MTRVVIIGAGRGGTALIEIFRKDPLVKILGVADIRPQAPGLKLAKKLGIATGTDYRQLLRLPNLDILIDVTGNPPVEEELRRSAPAGVAVIGGAMAKFMWQLIDAQIVSKDELERHLIEYESLFRLYLREARHAVTEERTRIALDLHDGLVQTLVGINYKMDLLEQTTSSDAARLIVGLQEIRGQLRNAIEEARHVIFSLKPIYFDKLDLVPALRDYLKSYEKRSGIATSLNMTGEEIHVPTRTKVFLFRIVQESLSNVERHAKARQVHVKLALGKKDLEATIQDDGVGFHLEEVQKDPEKWASFGLPGIQERAKLLGGTASIQSSPGKGTTIRVSLPLGQREETLPDLLERRRSRRGPDGTGSRNRKGTIAL